MEICERIFTDSNVFIASLWKEDKLHKRVQPIIKDFERRRLRFVISNLIFLEIVTVISQRVGRKAAIKAGVDLLEHPLIEIVHINEMLQEDSWQIFQKIENKNVSFVDCSILATMRAEGIPTLFTFDTNDFQKLQKQYRFRFYHTK